MILGDQLAAVLLACVHGKLATEELLRVLQVSEKHGDRGAGVGHDHPSSMVMILGDQLAAVLQSTLCIVRRCPTMLR